MNLNACVITRPMFAFAAACVSLFLAWPAHAENMKNDSRIPTLAEMRLLPPYCPDTQIISRVYGRQQAPSKYDDHTKSYVDMYGGDFWHLHHYCFGLVDVVRSYRIFDRKQREGTLKISISEFSYVLRGISRRWITPNSAAISARPGSSPSKTTVTPGNCVHEIIALRWIVAMCGSVKGLGAEKIVISDTVINY